MKPKEVNSLGTFLNEKDIWFNISHNNLAMSCCDAANKRYRLGYTGITCFDELKSNFGYYIKNNKKHYVLLHCRGTQKIDLKKVNFLLKAEFIRLPKEELKNHFNLEYGLINPFLIAKEFSSIIQYFDSTVFTSFLPPYTMMTNAGNHNWGIEFNPKELNKVIKSLVVEDIVLRKYDSFKKPVIGILTGNSPESGILLWENINSNIRKLLGNSFRGDISFPRTIIDSIPEMGFSMELELRETQTKKIVLEGVKNLCENGASIVVLACNTTQYFADDIREICENYNSIFISMEEALISFLNRKEINQLDFLGIDYVTNFNKWSDFKNLKELFDVTIPSPKVLKEINELAFKVKENNVDGRNINKLRNLIKDSNKTGNVVIALTEISILLDSQKTKSKNNNRFFDTLKILAENTASRYFSEINNLI